MTSNDLTAPPSPKGSRWCFQSSNRPSHTVNRTFLISKDIQIAKLVKMYGNFAKELDFAYLVDFHQEVVCAQPGKQACLFIYRSILKAHVYIKIKYHQLNIKIILFKIITMINIIHFINIFDLFGIFSFKLNNIQSFYSV